MTICESLLLSYKKLSQNKWSDSSCKILTITSGSQQTELFSLGLNNILGQSIYSADIFCAEDLYAFCFTNCTKTIKNLNGTDQGGSSIKIKVSDGHSKTVQKN